MPSTTNFFIITYEATCFDIICRSSSGPHTIGSSNAMHVANKVETCSLVCNYKKLVVLDVQFVLIHL